ncbi:hypothetical protein [Hyphomonas sp.]|uniref:hypothetical protein n=1 Tax=Hyphomonas sp. TaxID=87 RepID=UPI00391CD1C8
MFVRPVHSALKLLVAALVSLAFVMAPVAAAQHSESVETACAVEMGEGHAVSDTAGHGDHHHAPGCGGCHIHLMGPGSLPGPGMIRSQLVFRAAHTDTWGHALPGDLFRPPRS